MAKKNEGVPKNAGNAGGVRSRQGHMIRRPMKVLRRMLKRNTLRDAERWANQHMALPTLRVLVPDYQRLLGVAGHMNLRTYRRNMVL